MVIYQRIGHRKSARARYELQVLRERVICEAEGREWGP
jgi:hypothetical protein